MKGNKRFKAFVVHLISLTLMFGPLPAFSESEGFQKNSILETGMGVLNKVGSELMQFKQQEFNMRMQAAQMQASRPKEVPARFFPQCAITPAGAEVPVQACQMSQNLVGVVQTAQSMQQVARANMDHYDMMMDKAQNSPLPKGIACLQRAKDGVGSAIKDKLNGLERLKEQIAKSNQIFEEQNKQILEDIKRTGNELFGLGRGQKFDVDQEGAEYEKMVTPECRDIIGSTKFKRQIMDQGFIGLRDIELKDLNQKAANHAANKNSYERDLNQKIQQIKSDIRKFGVEGFLEINNGSLSFERNGQQKFGSLNKAFQDFRSERSREVVNIRKSIQDEIGNSKDIDNLTRMDQNFKADFGEFVAQAEQQLKREEISKCVSGPVGLSPDQILSSLRYDSTGMSGDTINNYKSALQVILDNGDASAAEKESEIKKLDARFKGRIRIVYNDEDSVQRNESPYQMFQKIVAKCEQVYEQETDSNAGRSVKEKVKRAKKYMQDLQRIERTFASDLTNQLIDEVVNCSGRKLKAGQCNAGALEPSGDNFCIAQATDCAAQAASCYNQLDKHVKDRQNQIKGLAVTYNNNVAALISSQEALLAQVKAQVTRDSEFFKNLFPGATYSYPGDLFVEMPQLADFNNLGIELRGGGDIEALKQLPGKIDLLKEQLLQQWEGGDGNKGIAEVIQEYMDEQEAAMNRNKEKWATLMGECAKNQGLAQKAIDQQNKAQQEAFGEKAEKVGDFCQRFDALKSTNPAAGCNDDYDVSGLYKDSMKVSAHVNDDAIRYVQRYQEYCAMSQNESEKGSEIKETYEEKEALAEKCEDNDNDSTKVLEEMATDIAKAGGLNNDQLDEIANASSVDDEKVKKIIEENGGTRLKRALTKFYELKAAGSSQQATIDELQTMVRTAHTEAPWNTLGANARQIHSSALEEFNKLKSLGGFCVSAKIENFKNAALQATTPTEFKNKLKEYGNTSDMQNAGRAIASLANSPVSDPGSAFGQAEYADVECAATADAGRFGAGDFDFSLDPIGGSSLLNNFGLGK